MILIITNKNDITTDFVVKHLNEKHIKFYRLNTEDLITNIEINLDYEKGEFTIRDKYLNIEIDLNTIKSVYYRRPELPEIKFDLNNEEVIYFTTEVKTILEGLYRLLEGCNWVNDYNLINKTSNKLFQLNTAKEMGFNVPNSLVTNNVDSAKEFIKRHTSVICKSLKSGLISSEEDFKFIFTTELRELTVDQLSRIELFPIFLQENIIKEYDIRVTVVGEDLFAVKINSQGSKITLTDWRAGDIEKMTYDLLKLPVGIYELCLNYVKELGLKFGAIDLVLGKDNKYYFLEINPNGQWAWLEKALRIDISNAIINLLLNN